MTPDLSYDYRREKEKKGEDNTWDGKKKESKTKQKTPEYRVMYVRHSSLPG